MQITEEINEIIKTTAMAVARVNVPPPIQRKPGTTIRISGYHGGKVKSQPFLLKHFPAPDRCSTIVESFGGSAVTLLNTGQYFERDYAVKVYSDIDRRLCNFFVQLRDEPEKLIQLIALTPHSRSEYLAAVATDFDSPEITDLEKARRFYVLVTQAKAKIATSGRGARGWIIADPISGHSPISDIQSYLAQLPLVAKELLSWQIDYRKEGYKRIFEIYDDPDTFFYCDPPYYPSKPQETKRDYQFEFTRQDDYREFAMRACKLTGAVIVSGYETDLMSELFAGWELIKDQPRHASIGKAGTNRTHCIWRNPRCVELTKIDQPGLF